MAKRASRPIGPREWFTHMVKLGFNEENDPCLMADLVNRPKMETGTYEAYSRIRGLFTKGMEPIRIGGLYVELFWLDGLTAMGQVASEDTAAIMNSIRLALAAIGLVLVVGGTGITTPNSFWGRVREDAWGSDYVVAAEASTDDLDKPIDADPRWIEYPGRETTLHMVDGVGRIVGGVSGREHPADGIPKWCAWLNPSRHIGYYVTKEQAKSATEMAAREG